jgi:large subunit ribosomal protein L17
MITLGKKGDLAAYRTALEYITKEDVAKKLFSTIAPAYAEVNGGYTTVLKMGPRRGDGAEMAIVKLIDYKKPEAADAKAGKKEKKEKKVSAEALAD